MKIIKSLLLLFCLVCSVKCYSNEAYYDQKIQELQQKIDLFQKNGYVEDGEDINTIYEQYAKYQQAKLDFLAGNQVDYEYEPKSKKQLLVEELRQLKQEKKFLEDRETLSDQKKKDFDDRISKLILEIERFDLKKD